MRLVDKLCKDAGRRRGEVKNGMHLQVSVAGDESSLRKQAGKWMKPSKRKGHHDMISCGTPQHFIDLMEEYRTAGANHVNVVFVPVDRAPEQLELFAEKVLPHFK